ncbi:MAG: hypothetical protein MK007_00820 [Flavobacteriales bacterium]|jgi:hypothetical protein|nr:hypothetical protein [Flavobacteriales bacterium]
MNKIFLLLTLLFVSNIQSQDFKERDLIGEWVFKVNIKDAIKNSKDLNGIEKLAARTFSGYIENVLEKTQMVFDFKNDNTASVTIITEEKTEGKNVFYWKINEEGHLLLDGINDQQDNMFGETAYWVMENSKLVPYDKNDKINKGVYMNKIN